MLNKIERKEKKQEKMDCRDKISSDPCVSPFKNLSLKYQGPTTSNILNICESTLITAENNTPYTCPQCKIYKSKLLKFKDQLSVVSYLKQKNDEFKEEIELMSSNFLYILQLAAENITKGVKSKLRNILAQKQNIIKKQNQIIQRLQNQSQFLIDKVDAGIQKSEKIQELQQRIRSLEVENKSLKENKGKIYYDDTNSFIVNSTDIYTFQSGDRSPKDALNGDFHFASVQLKYNQRQKQSLFGIKKRKTLDIEKQQNCQEEKTPIASLNNLRMKINTIKSKLINQRF